MPLPDAVPKPPGSNIYRQLNAIKLGDLTNEQYEVVYKNIFLNDTSEDELRRLALIGLARQSFSPSSSGPIGQTQVVNVTITSSGSQEAAWGGGTLSNAVDVAGDDVVFPKGSVWQLMGASIYGSGFSGSVNHDIWLYPSSESTLTESKATLLTDVSNTAGNIPIIANENAFTTTFIDDTVKIWVESTGTFTKVDWSLTFARVR